MAARVASSSAGGLDIAALEALAARALPGRVAEAGEKARPATAATGADAKGDGVTADLAMIDESMIDPARIDPPKTDTAGTEPDGVDPAMIDLGALDRLRLLIGQAAERIVADAADKDGRIDLDGLAILTEAMKVLERVEKLAFPLRAQQQKRSDDELAGILERIDDRIIELAEAHAVWLVGERDRTGPD